MVLALEYLEQGIKLSTRNQYARVYHIWSNFCSENGLPEFGALVMKTDQSLSKVTMLSAAIANEHRIRLSPSPTSHESISKLFRGFKIVSTLWPLPHT
jgi:hypothetical protein